MERSLVEKEKRLHGSSTFPFAVYDNYELFPNFSKTRIDIHWHPETEFLYLRKGAAHVQIDDIEIILKERETAYIPPGAIHAARSVNASGFLYRAIVFDLNFLASVICDVTQLQYINRLKLRNLILPPSIGKRKAWEKLATDEIISIFAAEHKKTIGYEMSIKGSLYKILANLISQGIEAPINHHKKRNDLERIKLIIQYIQSNYPHKIVLDDMASLSNLSKCYFCRFFKTAVGKSPIGYLHYYRLLRAEELLKETNFKIIDIALMVGFQDLSHFNRMFRKHIGFTPSNYRRGVSISRPLV